MSQASKKRPQSQPVTGQVLRNIKEISFILLVLVAVYLAVALFSFHPADPGWSQAVSSEIIRNNGGVVGAWIADFLLYIFGYLGYLFPFVCAFSGWRLFKSRLLQSPPNHYQLGLRISGFVMLFIGGCGLLRMHFTPGSRLPNEIPGAGGIFGDGIGQLSLTAFGSLGSTLILLALFLIGLTLYSGLSWLTVMDHLGRWILAVTDRTVYLWREMNERMTGRRLKRERETVIKEQIEKTEKRAPPRIEPVIS
ncbi:MAG: DNA translocase FtsK 4TM domain-containing protein, partial [Gammaproteobacteria bacterium]